MAEGVVLHAPHKAAMRHAAAAAPGATDDSESGYDVGTCWVDTAAGAAYTCVNASAGAAVWTVSTLADVVEAAETATDTTTSATYNDLGTAMKTTPPAGTYLVSFSGSFLCSLDTTLGHVAIFSDGALVPHTARRFHGFNNTNIAQGYNAVATQAKLSVNGAQEIKMMWKRDTAGTLSGYERTLTLLRVAA